MRRWSAAQAASRVTSSKVGPRPPQTRTASASASARASAPRIRPTSSGTDHSPAIAKPAAERRVESQAWWVLTWPASSSLPTQTSAARGALTASLIDAGAVGRRGLAGLDRAEAGLVLGDVVLERGQEALGVDGRRDDPRQHLGLGRLRLQEQEVDEELRLAVRDERQVRVNPARDGLVD